ncbi:hypothetical protein LTR85_001344 [Meristemomyces frigidus]|nr:hypothetical protein LTR85_001344 [Meristemomyces frigidus]
MIYTLLVEFRGGKCLGADLIVLNHSALTYPPPAPATVSRQLRREYLPILHAQLAQDLPAYSSNGYSGQRYSGERRLSITIAINKSGGLRAKVDGVRRWLDGGEHIEQLVHRSKVYALINDRDRRSMWQMARLQFELACVRPGVFGSEDLQCLRWAVERALNRQGCFKKGFIKRLVTKAFTRRLVLRRKAVKLLVPVTALMIGLMLYFVIGKVNEAEQP